MVYQYVHGISVCTWYSVHLQFCAYIWIVVVLTNRQDVCHPKSLALYTFLTFITATLGLWDNIAKYDTLSFIWLETTFNGKMLNLGNILYILWPARHTMEIIWILLNGPFALRCCKFYTLAISDCFVMHLLNPLSCHTIMFVLKKR